MASPAPKRSPLPPEAPKQTAVTRFFTAPLTFLSFLISLALIDYQNQTLRARSHPPPVPSTIFGRVKAIVHMLLYRPQSNPYAYVRSPDARGKNGEESKENEQPWHWNTKQRKMIRMEVVDAFEIRQWVVAGLALGALVLGTLAWIAVGRIWVMLREALMAELEYLY